MADTVEAYLAALPEAQRLALERVRAIIKAAAPGAVEALGYGIPGFRFDGPLMSYGAAKAHCALYGQSPKVQALMAEDLAGFDTSKGTIRFTPEKPLPEALIVKFVQLRLAENAEILAARKAKKKA